MPVAANRKRDRAESGLPADEAATHDANSNALEVKDAAATPLDRVVVLNVGGTKITTLYSTLCSSPSLLAQSAQNNFQEFPRDSQGYPFLDRDPKNFVHILNYLRGYGLPNKADDLVAVAEDAERYQLDALKREIGLDPPPMWRFTPGPGVKDDGTEFSTSDILNVCGTEPLSPGLVHTIVFRMDKCELVSIGVVAFKEVQYDTQIRRQKNTVCYCNTGELVRCWSTDALYEQGTLYKSPDEITVRVEFAQPGVPLEVPASEVGLEPLPPPLQPALTLTAATGTATPPALMGSRVVPARDVHLVVDPNTPTLNTPASGAEPPGTSPTFQSSSPAMMLTMPRAALPPTSSATTPAPAIPAQAQALAQAQVLQTGSGGGGGGGGSGGGITAATAGSGAIGTATPPIAGPSATPGSPATATTAGGALPGGGSGAAGAPTSPSLQFVPVVLDPEDPDAVIGAIVTFMKGGSEVCRARWPAPVPPLQFAVSMQGASAVSILKTSSASRDEMVAENEE